ncbi:hypothetical protein BKA70DRAFT_865076 [Coprinopsis sp. MPI-PUGE-AT-0042]|nr:hypothetical protein BKA70DRAFT_865076 [Coprinopsis sp. MPI-PUGE-AT-0042]
MFAASVFVTSILNSSLLGESGIFLEQGPLPVTTHTFYSAVVQILLVLYGVSGFFATPKDRRKGRLRFIIISSLMVVMCTIDISFDLCKNFLILYTGGPDGVSYLQALRFLDASENWRWEPIGDALFFAAIAIGDILMLWRCLVLWTDRKWVVLLPALACLGSITSKIIYLVGDITTSSLGLRVKVQLTGAVSNVAMNIMITFLIVLRVMQAKYRAAKAFPNQTPPRWYSKVTALVVESAAPLAIFGICLITLRGINLAEAEKPVQSGSSGLQRARRNIVTDVVQCFYDAFCTLSPQMIIVRVTRGKAWTHSSVIEATDEGAMDLSQPMQFARSAKETTDSNNSNSI